MKVVFCLYGTTLLNEAKMMVDSCKRFGYEVWQLTDDDTPAVPKIDNVMRWTMTLPQVTYRYHWLSLIEPPYASLDVDLIVQRDISSGLDDNHDVALTKRENKDGMIYNGGVFFVNRRGFIEDCTKIIEQMPPEWQDWTGGQRAMVQVAETGRYTVRELNCSEWNYSPSYIDDYPSSARILHFKGKGRKQLMSHAYERLRA